MAWKLPSALIAWGTRALSWKELQHHLPRWCSRGGSSVQGSKQDWRLKLDEDAELGRGKAKAAFKCIIHKPYSYLKFQDLHNFHYYHLNVFCLPHLWYLHCLVSSPSSCLQKKREMVIISLTAFPPFSWENCLQLTVLGQPCDVNLKFGCLCFLDLLLRSSLSITDVKCKASFSGQRLQKQSFPPDYWMF